MNNEPVAWMKEVEGGTMYTNYEYPGSIPLYTHPAETITLAELRQTELYRKEQTRHLRELLEPKTLTETEDTECQYCKQGCIRCDARKLLTDEEIDLIGDEVSNLIDTYAGRREFARAILRKAQEK